MEKKVLISAGEASGDLHAANLIKALLDMDSTIKVRAMGSGRLKNAGAKIIHNSADMAVVGLWEVLINYKKLKAVLGKMQDEIKTDPPDLLILVDYQEFNLKLAKTAKEHGVKVLFYISPQVWAWRPHRVHKIGKYIDMMAVLFAFEEKFYKAANVPVAFVGHPLTDEVKPTRTRLQAMVEFGINIDNKTIGIFPGSRDNEIKRILPIQLEAAKILKKSYKNTQFILPVADALNQQDIQDFLKPYPELDIKLVAGNFYDVIQVCDVIISASGTATLEIALMGVPNVITYKISPVSFMILKRMTTIDKIGLVNIVAGKSIVQEFVQHKATPNNIAIEIKKILDDKSYRENMINELSKIKAKLGKKGGVKNIARLACSML